MDQNNNSGSNQPQRGRKQQNAGGANEGLSNCCHALHECMKPNDRFVFRDSYGSYGPCYLVETNHEGKFKIEPIESM